MNATITNHNVTEQRTTPKESTGAQPRSSRSTMSESNRGHQRPALTGKLYRFHGFRVMDVDGEPIGVVDWIWSDDTGSCGEFLGVQLRWLRGSARTIPAHNVQIDLDRSTVYVEYARDQIKKAPRFAIDRALTADQKSSIVAHYASAPQPVSRRVIGQRATA